MTPQEQTNYDLACEARDSWRKRHERLLEVFDEQRKQLDEAVAERNRLAQEVYELRRMQAPIAAEAAVNNDGEKRDALLADKARLVDAFSKYIDLLVAELNDVVPIAMAHGWRTQRAEAGEKARAAIDAAMGKEGKS